MEIIQLLASGVAVGVGSFACSLVLITAALLYSDVKPNPAVGDAVVVSCAFISLIAGALTIALGGLS